MGTYEDLEESVLKKIGQLPDRTIQDILKRRWGIGTDKAQTREEVGRALGLTPKAVRRKEGKGLKQMRSIGMSPQEAENFRNSEIGQRLLGSLRKVLDR